MIKINFSRSGIGAAVFLVASPTTAHHSAAMFDLERDITLAGVVVKYEWVNPHVYIQVETGIDPEAGRVWMVEGSSAYAMSQLGWSQDTLAPGDHVTIAAHPTRNPGSTIALADSVLKADGTLLGIRRPPGQSGDPRFGALAALAVADPPEPFVADGLSGQWLTRWDPDLNLKFREPLASWSLTEKGITAVESYDHSMNPARDCIGYAAPRSMTLPTLKIIEIGNDVTTIQGRTVHMNVDSHDGAPYSTQGHSIGWWEDGVLVVDTAHFTEYRTGHGTGLTSGNRKHLVERFELSPDRTSLTYTFVVEDPEYLAAPITGALELTYRPDITDEDNGPPCDPEIARRYLEE